MERIPNIAIYMRLSKEDGPAASPICPLNGNNRKEDSSYQKEDDTNVQHKKNSADMSNLAESNSISMQRQVILGYIDSHFTEYRVIEFQDDGYSGTNLAEVW